MEKIENLRILYVNTLYYPFAAGGAEVTLRTLVELFQEFGHEVTVASLTPGNKVIEENINGVKVVRFPLENIYWPFDDSKPSFVKKTRWHLKDTYNKKMSLMFADFLDAESPHVISFHNLSGWSQSLWNVAKEKKIPAIQVLHDFYNICPNANMFKNGKSCNDQCIKCHFLRKESAKLSNNLSAVVAISQFVLDQHLKSGLFSEVKIKKIIHNIRAIDQKNIFPKNKVKEGKLVLGFMGTLAPIKGVEYLIDVFNRLKDNNWELLIAGKGDSEYVKKLTTKANNNITFLGHVDPADFFTKIDILVFPSLWEEPLGMVTVEAFAYGVPVVGSRRGGIKEMIQHGYNGFLFEPNNSNELEDILKNEINDFRLNELKESAYESARKHLDKQSWLEKYQEIYDSVLGR